MQLVGIYFSHFLEAAKFKIMVPADSVPMRTSFLCDERQRRGEKGRDGGSKRRGETSFLYKDANLVMGPQPPDLI